MKRFWIVAVVILALAPAFWLARANPGQVEASAGGVESLFVPVDVFLDTGKTPLGAYQIEVVARDAKFVGLEGGEAAAFKKAPYYDPGALAGGGKVAGGAGERIIVAAFSTDESLPTGSTRVARLHLMLNAGEKQPDLTSKLVVATDTQGNTVAAKLTLRPMQGETR